MIVTMRVAIIGLVMSMALIVCLVIGFELGVKAGVRQSIDLINESTELNVRSRISLHKAEVQCAGVWA